MGIDIAPSLVAQAQTDHPGLVFHCGDLLSTPLDESFDWVFASGALSYKLEESHERTDAMLEKMWSVAREGLASPSLATDHIFSSIASVRSWDSSSL